MAEVIKPSYVPYKFFYVTPQLAGMACPGIRLKETGKGGTPREEITLTMKYLKEEGFSLIISLANQRSARFIDPEIKAVWLETLAGEAFEHIPNEDHASNPTFRIGEGPTAEKLQTCIDIATPYLAEGKKVAVYCRGGCGRTGTFLSALLTSQGCEAKKAITEVGEAMKAYKVGDSLHLELEMKDNGGLDAIKSLLLK